MKSLREKIKESGYTKTHVAKLLGISTATLSRVLSGKQRYVSDALDEKIKGFIESK